MRNRAKCKLCKNIIESLHVEDHVPCNCDEIAVSGGEKLIAWAKNWENFMRVDDEGNEIIVKVGENKEIKTITSDKKPNRKELIELLEEMIRNIEDLPPHAMTTSITHYDFCSALLLISSILKAE